ncbi:NUDIX domain-containing protein [Nocardioides mesophilus]|uniref:NUDIX domain-containing protein n=1 Tax=Nocardioides mesophilus TaxID=433659 RepID=A0A7G9RHJ5_9ACTN|nr:NUDIX domain-containing protein [Nocardioides mesophilus]
MHADALTLLRDWTAPDDGQERLRRAYVAHLEEHPDGLSRTCRPSHLTAGALIVSADHREVLLTLHAKAREWYHTGGHCEPGDATLAAAALREGREESGLDRLDLDPVPIQLDRHDVPFCGPAGGGPVHHLDVRFVAVAAADAVHAVSEESLDVAWWPVDALPGTADLPALVERALARLGSRPAGQSSGSSSAAI